MKGIKKPIFFLLAGLFTAGLLIGIVGCENHIAVAPDDSVQRILSPGKKNINFITWNDSAQSFNKVYTTSKWINKYKGGELYMVVEGGSIKGSSGVAIKTLFNVAPNSISQSTTVKQSIDDEVIDFMFSPSGTTFNPPALFTVVVYGADLTGVNPDSVNMYYVNPNGQWQVMPSEEVVVDTANGFIRIVNAEISHFSRYALSKG